MKKRVLILCSFILIFAIILGISYKSRTGIFESKDYYTRAQAAKMFALLVEPQDNIEEAIVTEEFTDVKKDSWYGKYVTEAVRFGFLEGDERTKQFSPEAAFSYQDAGKLLKQVDLQQNQFDFPLDSSNAMKRQDVNQIYEKLIQNYAEKSCVQMQNVYIYDCNAEEERLITNIGQVQITGFDLSALVGKCVTLYCQNLICAAWSGTYDGEITLSNVWCETSQHNGITVYTQQCQTTLSGDLAEGTQYSKVVADITIANQKINSVKVKNNVIAGKVLSLQDKSIEVEGAGSYEADSDMPIYKVYDTVKQESARNILLGYDSVSFVLEDNRIVAALLTEAVRAQNIRVLLNTSGFSSQFHNKVKISCDRDFTVTMGGKTKNYPAGKSITFKRKSKSLKKGRVIIKPVSEDGMLTISSIQRSYGSPSYHGSVELALYDEGICVVNETGLEQYLYSVVPSEMPVSYGEEALKVQAVCARSYAYTQILDSSYGMYGAHLDDSVNSQVYNNTKESRESIHAVDSTCGQVLFSGEDVVSTYFFSTSCGYTANAGDVWMSSNHTPDYLTGQLQAEEGKTLHLDSEEVFQEFIDRKDAYDFYEKDVNWFRWTITMSREQVQAAIDTNLASVLKYIKVKNKRGKYVSKELTSIGTVKDMSVQQRSESGVIKRLVIQGSDAQIQVNGEFAIRKLLGNSKVALTLNDGSRSQQAMLPSGYFYIAKTQDGKGNSSQFSFNGGGYGHGVGMSQNGVKAMNDRGYSFEQILNHFFPKTTLQNIY